MPALSSIPPPVETLEIPWPEMFSVSVEQYHAMMAAGAITGEDRVELLCGRLVEKMSKHPPHKVCNRKIDSALCGSIPAGWHVANQGAVALRDSESEPDAMVVRGKLADSSHWHPGPHEVELVEVAESSLSRDRGYKRQLYAEAGIPFCWIANLIDRQVEVYRRPARGDYSMPSDYFLGDAIPLILDGAEAARFDVKDLLP